MKNVFKQESASNALWIGVFLKAHLVCVWCILGCILDSILDCVLECVVQEN